jgi:folate-binding protein YgfZ
MSDNTMRDLFKVTTVEDEFFAAITSAAIVDRSSVGKLFVTGEDRLDLLHRLSTNELVDLKPFSATMTVFTTDKGRIVDYVRVLVLSDSLMLLTSQGQESRLMSWIDKYTIMEDIQIRAVTSNWIMLSIVGPEARDKARQMLGQPLEPDTVVDVEFANTTVTVSYQTDLSVCVVNILVPSKHAPIVLGQLTNARKEMGIETMSTQGYECFRVFHGIPEAGCELSSEFNPFEVGLRHAISFTKGCYIGQEVIARLDTYEKIQRKLIRLSFDKCLPDCHCAALCSKDGETVGVLSSFAPTKFKGEYLALGVAKKASVMLNDTLYISSQSTKGQGIVAEVFDRDLR